MARAKIGRIRIVQRVRSRAAIAFRIDDLDLGFRLGAELAVVVKQPARKGKRGRMKRLIAANLILRLEKKKKALTFMYDLFAPPRTTKPLRMITAKEKIADRFRASRGVQNRDTPRSAADASREHDWR